MARIDPNDIPPAELARYRTTFALRRLSTDVQSAVLSDGIIAARMDINLSHPVRLPEDITVDRTVLFAAFQCAADGEPIPDIFDIGGVKRDIDLEIVGDAAVLTYGTHRVSFPQAILLSANPSRRGEAAAQLARRFTLSMQSREQFERIVARTPYTHDDFFDACNILLSAPEPFADALKDAAKIGTLAISNFLPDHDAYWENITARRLASETMAEFATNELAAERAAIIRLDPVVAVDVMSLTFSAYELVPLDALRAIDSDRLLQSLRRLLSVPDPHALAAALDVCADRSSEDTRFVELGDDILDQLLGDPKRLHGELATYATAYIIAATHLAKHERLRREPVYWRRLAAAAHAALVTRVLGSAADDDEHPLFDWAMRLTGKTFYFSVLNDAHVEPRWRPDWITANFLAADIYGRLRHVLQRLADASPPGWRKKIDDAQGSINQDVPPYTHAFPSFLQGGRAKPTEMPPPDTPVGEMFTRFAATPTVEKFLTFLQFAYAFGFPPAARQPALSAIQALRAEIAATNPILVQGALQLGAYIAAGNRDVELADAVATVALEGLVSTLDTDRLMTIAAVLLECAAASDNRAEALATLARRLESMAFMAPAATLPDGVDILRILQSINEELAPLLARAVATAKLGAPRITAA
ncbi:hypothetical protein [Bradyrhizobium sp. STM 3566]|uniref:hypothetical protein n=1 Tax=Bradyrhizobium sp. STM 3566 TaxID=578928 RepID=UPI00388E28E5